MSKRIKFTDKVDGKLSNDDILVGCLGERVYKLTSNVNEMNDAIRWCNRHHAIGEKFDCDKYQIEIIG